LFGWRNQALSSHERLSLNMFRAVPSGSDEPDVSPFPQPPQHFSRAATEWSGTAQDSRSRQA
jgi:hypothetical protein